MSLLGGFFSLSLGARIGEVVGETRVSTFVT